MRVSERGLSVGRGGASWKGIWCTLYYASVFCGGEGEQDGEYTGIESACDIASHPLGGLGRATPVRGCCKR